MEGSTKVSVRWVVDGDDLVEVFEGIVLVVLKRVNEHSVRLGGSHHTWLGYCKVGVSKRPEPFAHMGRGRFRRRKAGQVRTSESPYSSLVQVILLPR